VGSIPTGPTARAFCPNAVSQALAQRSYSLLCAAAGLVISPRLTNESRLIIPINGLGIAWASIMAVPYIMAVRKIPSSRYGFTWGSST
jgi:aspartyl/asparaginyl beta-hydroxylase (cupin superfamily)